MTATRPAVTITIVSGIVAAEDPNREVYGLASRDGGHAPQDTAAPPVPERSVVTPKLGCRIEPKTFSPH